MKIVVDARAIKQTGVGRYIEETLSEILKLDSENQYVFLVRDEDRSKIDFKADNLELVSANYNWYTFAEQTKGLKLLRSLKPDLVHFPNFNFPMFYPGRFIMTYHDLTLWDYKNINRAKRSVFSYYLRDFAMKILVRVGVHRTRYLLVPSDYVRDRMMKKFHLRPHKVIRTYEAGEAAYQKPRVDLEKFGITKPFIFYAGAAYPHKNLERLIIAFGKLTTDYMLDVQLVLAGKRDTFSDHIAEEVNKAGLKEQVIFTDYVTDAELAGLYKAAEIYSFPSLSEGFGLPGLEAMSYGLPVASSKATCLPEVYGEAAVYYDPEDIESIAKVMADLIADKSKQEDLKLKGYEQIKKYSWEDCARETLAVYKRALKNKK